MARAPERPRRLIGHRRAPRRAHGARHRHGDEVIIPAKSFFATAGVVARLGATPVFVDVDPLTYNVTEELVRDAITERTRAIIPVHLFGQVADLGSLYSTPKDERPAIIEDAAQSLGARLGGVSTGHLGDVSCTSFSPQRTSEDLVTGARSMDAMRRS